jgi:hypothetical protein
MMRGLIAQTYEGMYGDGDETESAQTHLHYDYMIQYTTLSL